jgi:hypothetical protein
MKNSADSTVGGNDEQSFEALMMRSVGKLPLALSMSSAVTPTKELSPNAAIDNNDGDVSKHSSSNSISNSNHYLEQFSNIEDYRNARSKLAHSKQQKNSPGLDADNKNKLDEKIPSRRKGRRKSNSHPQRVKMDGELVRKKMEEIHVTVGAFEGEGDDFGRQDPDQDSSKAEESSDNETERFSKKNINNNTLSIYFSPPQQGTWQGRRGRKSTNKSITTSSTTSTKKQSNSTIQKRCSMNELVLNSAWADGVKNNSEFSERRIRCARRHSKMDDHYPSTPNSDGPTKNRFAMRRSISDVNAITRSDFGSRNKNRRKFRRSISESLVPNTRTSKRLASLFSSVPSSPKSPKSTADTSSAAESVLGTIVTPYSILRDPKYKLSTRSYSDRVMIAAESNKTPMAALRKYLQDEKELSASADVDKNVFPDKTGRTPRRSKQMPQSLLQIPFFDGTTNIESSEKRGDDEVDNNKAALAVQAFGKSIAKSMRKQAKNTKRKIGQHISKMAPPQTAKSTISSMSKPASHVPLDDTATSETPLFVGHIFDSSYLHDDPLNYLKPPSGHCPRKETGFHFPTSNVTKDSVHRTNRYVPPLPLTPESESNHRQDSSGLNVGDDLKQGYEENSRKISISKVNRKNRQKRKSNSKKRSDAQLESSVEKSFVQASSDGDPSSKYSDQGSSSRGYDFQESPIIESKSDESPTFDDNDDEEEDSSIEGSFNINIATNQKEKINKQLQPLVVDGNSTIKDDGKGGSSQKIRDSSKQADLSCTPNKHPVPASPNTETTTSTPSQSIACKHVYTFYDRCNSSSISTLVTSVPTSPSQTRSKNNSEKGYDNLNQHNDNEIDSNSINNKKECRNQRQKNKNTSEHMEVPKKEETNEMETSNTTNTSYAAFQDNEISIEVETKADKLASEPALNEEASKKKEDDGLSQPTGTLEASKTKVVRKHEKTKESNVLSEPFDLLKQENKRENRAKLRKEATRERFERHKKNLQTMRLKQNIIDREIAVDYNPLDLSKISCTYHASPEQRKSAKPRRSFTSESSSRNGQPQPANTAKERKSKNSRRGSKIKSRIEQTIRSKAGSITAPAEQPVEPFVEEKNNSMRNVDEAASPI